LPNLRRIIMKVNDNVYMMESAKGSYVYFIQGDEPVLIDTGMSFRGRAVLRELEAMGVQPDSIKHILVTHHDLDHVGSLVMLQQLTGADIWASETDIPYITGEKPRYGFKKTLGRIMPVKKPESMQAFFDGQTIAGVQVISTPGHTPGHVCFLYDGVLFAGDLVENRKEAVIPYPAPWTVDFPALLDSIKRAEGYDLYCPAGRP
jgi:glyoxylase-like metal-dependent hydrolase (beta-lactamase superfamily II)